MFEKYKYRKVSINDIKETMDAIGDIKSSIINDIYDFCIKEYRKPLRQSGYDVFQDGIHNFVYAHHEFRIYQHNLEKITHSEIIKDIRCFGSQELNDKLDMLGQIEFYVDPFSIKYNGYNSSVKEYADRYQYPTCYKFKDTQSFFKRLKEENPKVYLSNPKSYHKLVSIVKQYNYEYYKNISLFSDDNKVKSFFQYKTLENRDLSEINFDGKNISKLNISKNKEVKINFDKIVKDLTDSNIFGYNLKKYKFVGWNLTNTDLRNTGATIDLGSCIISYEGKMNSGTMFDEENTLLFNNLKLTPNQIKELGIKIYKKEIK